MPKLNPNYNKLFRYGIIAEWYLREDQFDLYNMIRSNDKTVVNTHRRFGKSTVSFVYIFERCLTEKIMVRCGGITQKSFHDIFNTLMDDIFFHAPEYKPQYQQKDGCYLFHTGSRIYLFGNKDREESDKARGTLSHIIYCDEFGFWRFKAGYTLKNVLSPQLDTVDNPRMIITSTAPEDLTHEYISQIKQAEIKGCYYLRDINKSLKDGNITNEQHIAIIDRCGGIDTEAYRREYLCELIPSSERLVIPEAHKIDQNIWIGKQDRPDYYKSYVMIDMGLKDFTCALFGYHDFNKNRIIIEHELLVNYKTTKEIVELCKDIELTLGYKDPFRRADAQAQQLWDINNEYGYRVSPLTKSVKGEQDTHGYRDSVINDLRINIGRGKILVDNNTCPNLTTQLKYGIYNENRTDFERTDEMGHLDALMALAYMNYHMDWTTNPYPLIPEYDKQGNKVHPSTHMIIVPKKKNNLNDIL
jgi:hypothetical protein